MVEILHCTSVVPDDVIINLDFLIHSLGCCVLYTIVPIVQGFPIISLSFSIEDAIFAHLYSVRETRSSTRYQVQLMFSGDI